MGNKVIEHGYMLTFFLYQFFKMRKVNLIDKNDKLVNYLDKLYFNIEIILNLILKKI